MLMRRLAKYVVVYALGVALIFIVLFGARFLTH
jgi:hypothetical protein